MIITIDGPAASGKGTLAKLIAQKLDLAHLDTGALYRGAALAMLRAGADLGDKAAATRAAKTLDLSLLDDPQLRAEETGAAASKIASISCVRAALDKLQRDFAAHPPGGKAGAVLDGRDIGSVICPDADVKFYVEASVEERARRRHVEQQARGLTADLEHLKAEIAARDHQDMTRATAPLVRPDGAHLLDTTQMSIEAALAAALAIVASASHA